jgi:capsular polysaccharide biosynthesis protein
MPMNALEGVDWSRYDFIDLGCSRGGSISHCMSRFGVERGLGIDLDPKKVKSTQEAGFDAVVADARDLGLDGRVSFVSMLDFCEHLPDLAAVEKVIAAAAESAQDFLYIKHPSFEGEARVEELGLRQYWWDWQGHTAHPRVVDYCAIFQRLGLSTYEIRYLGQIADSQHPSIIPTSMPIDQSEADAQSVADNPHVTFWPPLWRRQDIFVALRPFDQSEWRAITRPTNTDRMLLEPWDRYAAEIAERAAAHTGPVTDTESPPKYVALLDHRHPKSASSELEWLEIDPPETVNTMATLAELAFQPEIDSTRECTRREMMPPNYTAPAIDIIRLNNAWLETSMCVAVTSDHKYAPDTLRVHRQAEENGYLRAGRFEFILPDCDLSALEGRALLVGLPTGGNYFHWLFEAVPRWLLAREHIDADTQLLVPQIGPVERSALLAAGVPDDRITTVPDRTLLKVPELILVPRGMRGSVQILPSAARALRAVAAPVANPCERLFISRSAASRRKIINEEQVSALLQDHGFRSVRTEEMNVQQQIDLFSRAHVVLGLHGAGLANAVFAPAGATLIELQPHLLDDARVMLYWNMAAACGLRYVQLICHEVSNQADTHQSQHDVTIDIRHLDAALREILPNLF